MMKSVQTMPLTTVAVVAVETVVVAVVAERLLLRRLAVERRVRHERRCLVRARAAPSPSLAASFWR